MICERLCRPNRSLHLARGGSKPRPRDLRRRGRRTVLEGPKKAFFAYTVSFFPRVGRFTSKQAEVFYLVSGNG